MSKVVDQLRGVIAAIRKELNDGEKSDTRSGLHYTEVGRIAEELLSHIRTQTTKHITAVDSNAYTIVQASLDWISSIHCKDQIEEKLDSVVVGIAAWQKLLNNSPKRPPDTKVINLKGLDDPHGLKIDRQSREDKALTREFNAYSESQRKAKAKLSLACEELLTELGRELSRHHGQNASESQIESPTAAVLNLEEEWVTTKVGLCFRKSSQLVKKQSTGEVREVKGKICFNLLLFIAARGSQYSSKSLICDNWEYLGGRSDGESSLKSQLSKVRTEVLDRWEMVLEISREIGWRVNSAPDLWEKRAKEIENNTALRSNAKTQKQPRKN